ncbi:MAG: bifunctional DNA-formamidopyrimidine glycosylase/DNA-(apurinic or apyrimidinic site) lyase [Cryobacterium sp.]|nr:bifunctional DNA-formamidopyrimidine glycosylase/DNA-(apurinic or apyrimidinic site) lyase [Cryobacterium sp.]
MPELPEAEVVRAGLASAVDGAVIRSVEVLDERALRRHDGPSEDFVARLEGRRLSIPSRRGKFLWLPLDADPDRGGLGEALVVHLGMSGQMLLRSPGTDDPLTRVSFELEAPGGKHYRLHFVDQRLFGSLAIDELVDVGEGELIPTAVLHIARDPLDPKFDEAAFIARLRSRRTGIKRALLDQKLVSGIGNIYADESLWAARVHFETPADALSARSAHRLLVELRGVLLKALAEGGTSFDWQYRNVNGESGYFSHSLNAYGQQGKPCPRCGKPIKRVKFMNRSSHFCPYCQRTQGR